MQLNLVKSIIFDIKVAMPKAANPRSGSLTLPPPTDDESKAMEESKTVQAEEQAAPSRPPGSSANTVTASHQNTEPKNPDLVSSAPATNGQTPDIYSHKPSAIEAAKANPTGDKKVSWNGPEDPENPKNWPTRRKWAATLLVSALTFISPVSSSMVAPALGPMADAFSIRRNSVESQMMLSIFLLAYAIGPLFLGPLSESFGRRPVLLLSSLFYLAWNLGCGFSQNAPEMLIFRFLSGIGGSAPQAVGGGVLSLAPLLGPAIGPLAGGFITENTTWRWTFWATSIAAGIIQVTLYFFLPESYTPVILQRRRDRLAKETGSQNLHTAHDHEQTATLIQAIGSAVVRPTRMLVTQPIMQLITLYIAYLFGLFYLIISTFPTVFSDVYHESLSISGLNYISLGVGYIVGAQANAHVTDRLYKHLKAKRADNKGLPEFRIPAMFVGSAIVPVGLFWYGWSVQARLHWIMPNAGIVIFSMGAIVCLQCMQAYIIDSYSRFAASAMAAAVVLRSLASFGFPLFAPHMYATLGYGWGNSLLGFVSVVVGIPAPYVFWVYGARLRAMSKYAAD
ncbi:hypothetical protein SLS63_009317 [Diaporthe eres]|uniref:Major facilitator superfamily (MFS) profile domain-containing protein n=1 Tax=Diaporthe eres TaxID=83184 RepID=A0ABR1P030_DIAER